MKLLSIKLPPDLDEKLRAVARRKRLPLSEIVRESLAAYVSGEKGPEPGSFLEAARDLVGRVEGPPDLSASPHALAGYGEPGRGTARRRRRR